MIVKDRFLSFLSALLFAYMDDLGVFPTSSIMALAAALLKIGEAIALCSELLGPLPPAKFPFLLGDIGGLILVSLDAGEPNKRS